MVMVDRRSLLAVVASAGVGILSAGSAQETQYTAAAMELVHILSVAVLGSSAAVVVAAEVGTNRIVGGRLDDRTGRPGTSSTRKT